MTNRNSLKGNVSPKHLQDAPRTMRNTFDVVDPNDPKKTVKVVFASFAVCLERESNALRHDLERAIANHNADLNLEPDDNFPLID